jgi:hypothetical protein
MRGHRVFLIEVEAAELVHLPSHLPSFFKPNSQNFSQRVTHSNMNSSDQASVIKIIEGQVAFVVGDSEPVLIAFDPDLYLVYRWYFASIIYVYA